MGRKRVIDQDGMLDAAEAVVVRDGAARLTLDAVATLAGISKASVLYAYKNKQALVQAVIDRRVSEERARVAKVTAGLGAMENGHILGRIAAAENPPKEGTRAVALNLSAALAQNEELRAGIQQEQASVIKAILDTSKNPRGALLAFLALEGLKTMEYLDIYHWPEDQRRQILREINWLVDEDPDATKEFPQSAPE